MLEGGQYAIDGGERDTSDATVDAVLEFAVAATELLEARRRGLFPEFQAPSRVFSPFPTLSIVCFTSLLQDLTGFTNPGYDVWYYDSDRKEMIGGTRGEGFKQSHAYMWLFDLSRRNSYSHDLAYFFPRGTLKRDLQALESTMRKKTDTPQLVYMLSTDAIAHLMGRDELLRQLKRVSRTMSRVREEYRERTGHPLKVVMFSDHGQAWGPQHRLGDDEVRAQLAAAGYHNTTALEAPGDVILVSFGNVRTGIVYTAEADRPGVADVIRRQPGIALTFYRTQEGAVVLDREGRRGRIMCDEGRYRYQPETGDPLEYGPLLEILKAEGALEADGWARQQDWLEVSQRHPSPDALHRVCTGFHTIVTFPADVLFSTDPGKMFGPWKLQAGSEMVFGGIKGNHGGIGLEESSAFVVSTDGEVKLEAVTQYNRALREAIFKAEVPRPPATPPMVDGLKDRWYTRWQ